MYDYIVVGSGFGGAVSALRLVEKGYRVLVLEKGQWVGPPEMERASKSLRRFLHLPLPGFSGYFAQWFFRHITIVGGVGVGGGSLVYAAVLLRPKKSFFEDPAHRRLGVDFEKELLPHYDTVEKMLGVTENPHLDRQDEYLRQTAEAMSAGDTWGPVNNGIYFGEPEKNRPGPVFRWTRAGTYGLRPLWRLPCGLREKRQEQPGQKLPPPGDQKRSHRPCIPAGELYSSPAWRWIRADLEKSPKAMETL